jgi:acetone carboxylase gamma subunit
MLVSETGIELLQDPEHAAPSDQAFVAQIETEGVFERSCGRLVASYHKTLDNLLPAIVPHLTDSQLIECLRSQPCEDATWLERGYITPPC